MNKVELKKKLTELNNTFNTDNYEMGSNWQQDSARLVERYVNTYPAHNFTDDETVSLIFALNTDVQVRDYAMGLIDPTSTTQYDAWFTLMTAAPVAWRNAQASLASAIR